MNQRPGHWNHACNLRIGLLGGRRDQPLTPSRLTSDEQYSHISLWCLWGSPMIIWYADRAARSVHAIAVVQRRGVGNPARSAGQARPAGEGGQRRSASKSWKTASRPWACWIPVPFYACESPPDWPALGLQGPQRVRDLWRQKDLGVYPTGFAAEIAPHGVVLVRPWCRLPSEFDHVVPDESSLLTDPGGSRWTNTLLLVESGSQRRPLGSGSRPQQWRDGRGLRGGRLDAGVD